MQHDAAQVTGIRALGWLAAQDELFDAFLAFSGADVSQVRAAAADPAFLGAVLDFLSQRDDWVIDCAAALDLAPQDIGLARAVLGGRGGMHWT